MADRARDCDLESPDNCLYHRRLGSVPTTIEEDYGDVDAFYAQVVSLAVPDEKHAGVDDCPKTPHKFTRQGLTSRRRLSPVRKNLAFKNFETNSDVELNAATSGPA